MILLETESGDDLVVLRPQWLAGDLLGRLLSHDTLQRAPPGGLLTTRELMRLLDLPAGANAHAVHSRALLELLAALDLCTPHAISSDRSDSPNGAAAVGATPEGESVTLEMEEVGDVQCSRNCSAGQNAEVTATSESIRDGSGGGVGGQWGLLRRISRLSLSASAADADEPPPSARTRTAAARSPEDAALHELVVLNTLDACPPQTARLQHQQPQMQQEACAHIGMQYRSSFQQLLHLFARIQTRLRRHVLQLAGDADASDDEEEEENDDGDDDKLVFENRASRTGGSPSDLQQQLSDRQSITRSQQIIKNSSRRFELAQWHNGSRLRCLQVASGRTGQWPESGADNKLSSSQSQSSDSLLVEFSLSMIESYDIVELCARAPKWRLADARAAHAIYQLHVDLLGLIERTVCDACPNIELEKYVLSAKELRNREALHNTCVRSNSSTTRQMLTGTRSASIGGGCGRGLESNYQQYQYGYAGSNARPIKKVHQTVIFRQLFETRANGFNQNNSNSALCSATASPGYSMSDLQLSDSSSSLQNSLSPRAAAAPIRIRELDEPIDELLCFGSEELLTHLKFGTELHASSIPRLVLQKLCAIFDRCDPLTGRWSLTSSSPHGGSGSFYSSGVSSAISGGTLGFSGGLGGTGGCAASEQCGWPLLARQLGLDVDLIAQLEESSSCSLARSCTWLALEHWARSPRATVRKLLEHLHELQQRPDPSHPQAQAQAEEAVQLLYHYSPLFVYSSASLATTESADIARVSRGASGPHVPHRARRRQRRSTASALSESDDDSTLAPNISSDDDSDDNADDPALDQTTTPLK